MLTVVNETNPESPECEVGELITWQRRSEHFLAIGTTDTNLKKINLYNCITVNARWVPFRKQSFNNTYSVSERVIPPSLM